MHFFTNKCVDKAKQLIEKNDLDSVIYAALQARMAIEHLFYELVPLYEKELPLDVLSQWQPQSIIREILECDPEVQEDKINVTLYDENPDGSAGDGFSLGKQTAVKKTLLKNHYHRLGHYLHAGIDQKPHDTLKVKEVVAQAIADLETYGDDTVMVNINKKFTITCEFCLHTFLRSESALIAKQDFQCRGLVKGKRCNAIFEAVPQEDAWNIGHKRRSIECPDCKVEIFFPVHILGGESILICVNCSVRFVLQRALAIQKIETS